MTPREARVPEVRAGELAQYEASGRLRPRPWPVGPSESYGKVDFEDGEGKTVLTAYIQRRPEEGYVLHIEQLVAPLRVDGTLLRLSPAPHTGSSTTVFRCCELGGGLARC